MAKTSVNLYRAVRGSPYKQGTVVDGEPVAGVLFPDFYRRKIGEEWREPDVDMIKDDKGEEWVQEGGGTSLFDKRGVFASPAWKYFDIPEGTDIPASLVVRKTGWNKKFQANHWQIEVRTGMMTKTAMQGDLETLARNAVARSIELAKGGKTTV
jgi:hypothetical protein